MSQAISYKKFKEAVKDARDFESRNHKRYRISYIDGDFIGLFDPSKGEEQSAYLKDIYSAVKEHGADNCTVEVMKEYVDRKAAPMAAALIYSTLGNGAGLSNLKKMAAMLHEKFGDDFEKVLSRFVEAMKEHTDDAEAEAPSPQTDLPRYSGILDHCELAQNGVPNTYKQMLSYCDKADLHDLAFYLHYPGNQFELMISGKSSMEEKVFDLATQQVELWIDHLPLYDLQLLHDIVIDHRHEFPDTAVILLIVQLGFAQWRVIKGKDCLVEYQLRPEIEEAIAPHINAALARKKSSNTVALDQALWGILNIYGTIPEFALRMDLPRVLKAWGVKVHKSELDDYLENGMIPMLCGEYDEKLMFEIYYSKLLPVDAWIERLSKNFCEDGASPLDDFNRVKALGEYPNVKPYSPAAQDFYDMLRRRGLKNTTDYLFAYFYAKSQRADYTPVDFVKEVIKKLDLDIEKSDAELKTIQDFSNDMPRFYLYGYSPNERMKEHLDPHAAVTPLPQFPFSAPAQSSHIDTTPPLWPKVGRNDPCPCGSGKKFKNCHGRLN